MVSRNAAANGENTNAFEPCVEDHFVTMVIHFTLRSTPTHSEKYNLQQKGLNVSRNQDKLQLIGGEKLTPAVNVLSQLSIESNKQSEAQHNHIHLKTKQFFLFHILMTKQSALTLKESICMNTEGLHGPAFY